MVELASHATILVYALPPLTKAHVTENIDGKPVTSFFSCFTNKYTQNQLFEIIKTTKKFN